MSRLAVAFALFVVSGCSPDPAPVDIACQNSQTCSESVCPELCAGWDEVTIANCYRRYAYAEPGQCFCLCEDEDRNDACFAYGAQGASYGPEFVRTEHECNQYDWSETCEPICEAECVWGFPLLETRCRHSGSTFTCECVCGACQFAG